VTATPSGLKTAGEVPPEPSTPAERLAMWCDGLPSPAPEMLRTLAARGEAHTDADELAAALAKKPTGGHWNLASRVAQERPYRNRLFYAGRTVAPSGKSRSSREFCRQLDISGIL
jgi:hypothetical protein